MSLPLRNQPLQGPDDYRQSPAEINGFLSAAVGRDKSSITRLEWARFGARPVANFLSRNEPKPANIFLPEYFSINNTRTLAGNLQAPLPCKCGCKTGKEPFSCSPANPQASSAKCGQWNGLPTSLYLYNGQYLCCQQSPFNFKTPNPMADVNKWKQSLTPTKLGAPHHLDPNTERHRQITKNALGGMYCERPVYVSTRVSTS